MEEVALVNAALLTPVALASMLTLMYTKLKHIEKELEEVKKQLNAIDKKVDKLGERVGYMEGRLNGLQQKN